MYHQRLCHLLVVAVSLLCLAHASWPDFSLFERHLLVPRQDVSSGEVSNASSAAVTSSAAASTTTPPSSTSAPPSTTESSPSTTPETSTTSSDPPSQSSKAPQTSRPTTPESKSQADQADPTPSASRTPAPAASQSTSTASQPGRQTSPAESETNSEEAATTSASSAKPTPVVLTSTEVITRTNSDGSTVLATTVSKTTTTPELSSDGSGETSGMTPKTRNTIIGVVVGVGGAIVLGTLGFVAWRIWGRRRNSEENDGLMDYDMAVTGIEKHEPGNPSVAAGPRSPFQSTLENYHQPTQVNASSNF